MTKGGRANLERLLRSAWEHQSSLRARRLRPEENYSAAGALAKPRHIDPTTASALLGAVLALILFIMVRNQVTVILTSIGLFISLCWLLVHILRARTKSKIALAGGVLGSLLVAIGVAWSGWPATDIRDMSNQELTQAERRLSASMRKLQVDFRTAEIESLRNPPDPKAQDATDRQLDLEKEFEAAFNQHYIADALAMRCELLRREDQPCPPPAYAYMQTSDMRLIALMDEFAGPTPVSDAADYLDELANKLQQ